ncbi:lipoate--protein ligase [Candidatus Phytoplasma ziziphi]|uniref:lipoate--protein ligase n=1 Tax=Ziziphus jujuba witches'-broom phytoplasma TaxID=135727 RepID=A0A660HMH6_ZIZJU|nr:lipoate--protein ligase [Candidatus Phytoplasma ziziphi]AYJ01233.1 lipoate--protein ligase [Candidatus Phytoplasma ziziphi]
MILVKYNRLKDFKPYFYFALEEYILNNLLKKDEFCFFFQWQIQGVVIGKNQIIENEVNLDFTTKNQIQLFRRPTGGGCVYNDPQTPLFSIITAKKDKNFNFKEYLGKIIEAFGKLGINLYFSGRNDILLNEKKVSGNAFMQNKNGMVMHGTLLYDCDIDTMVRCITPNNEKLISKGITSVSSRVTNLKEHLNGMSQQELMDYLNNYLTNEEYNLTLDEIYKIEQMAKKYSSKEWIFGEHPAYDKKLQKRFNWGNLEIFLSLNKGKISKIIFKGDFFHKENNLSEFLEKFVNVSYNKKSLQELLKNIDIKNYIIDASNKDLLSLLEEGILY